ncbi:unnamed protein product [Victoria cruziana]
MEAINLRFGLAFGNLRVLQTYLSVAAVRCHTGHMQEMGLTSCCCGKPIRNHNIALLNLHGSSMYLCNSQRTVPELIVGPLISKVSDI